jgi:hypothetical protein
MSIKKATELLSFWTVDNKWVCLTAVSTAELDSSKSDKVSLGLLLLKTVTCQKRSLLDLSIFDHLNEELLWLKKSVS